MTRAASRVLWALTLAAAGAVLAAVLFRQQAPAPTGAQATAPVVPIDATFVGTAACATCHRPEYDAWQTSQHRQAMQEPRPDTVLGNFENATFTYAGVTSTFFRRENGYWVRTDGADGTLQDFRIRYTFGVYPLQQYLIEQPGGRMQALSIAWDARPRDQGGARWYHLYPDERIDHRDELHWTGRQQNWNFMCADCHSTNVRKGYDASTNSFDTRFSELNVACEACHGPGSRHTDWAATRPWLRRLLWNDNGLVARLDERRGVTWAADASTGRPVRSAARTTSREIDTCAQCHARRAPIADGYVAGAAFHDFYAPSTLAPGLYEVDGQQRDEVYTYGSFLQSRMNHAGVTCSDCHDPHTGRTRASGNGLCTQCHSPAKYDAATHHFHPANSVASACVSCHMPARTYMGVDARRDHSFRVPRPDQSVALGVPNACTACHSTQPVTWAADQLRRWYGRDASGFQTFASVFHDDDRGAASAGGGLAALSEDRNQPAFVRASALARLARHPSAEALRVAMASLGDGDPLTRRSALGVFEALPPRDRLAIVSALGDSSRSVRVEAARILAPAAAAIVGVQERDQFTRAANEFMTSQRTNGDRPEARTSLGTFLAQLGRTEEAVAEFRAAIRLAPAYVPAYVNLADVYAQQGNEAGAEQALRDGLGRDARNADLLHALGLSLARARRTAEAVDALAQAAALAPDVARFSYAHAVALNSTGRTDEALRVVTTARLRHPSDRDLLFALATFQRDRGRSAEALRAAEDLIRLYPTDADAAALRQSLAPSAPR